MSEYLEVATSREAVDAIRGFVMLDFGENWCGHCQAAKPHVEAALAARPDVTHIQVLDGRGKSLGRSFKVKLWPTLVLLKDGTEVNRLVRPTSIEEVNAALASLA